MLNTIKLKLIATVNYVTRLLHKVDPDPVKIIDDIVGDIENKVEALSKAQDALAQDRAAKHNLIAALSAEIDDLSKQSERADKVKKSMTRILEG